MDIKQVITVLKQMQADGVIDRYAIGGAVGATFYLEPVATLDVDVFVHFQSDAASSIISVKPIYDYLTARGCTIEREYIVIAGTPVQFLAPNSPLVEEALNEAVDKDVDGMPVRVFTAEHVAAIALETGRAKDKTRLVQFLEEGALDLPRFEQILARYGLVNKWQQFQKQFLTDQT
jgi:hypothetical protein